MEAPCLLPTSASPAMRSFPLPKVNKSEDSLSLSQVVTAPANNIAWNLLWDSAMQLDWLWHAVPSPSFREARLDCQGTRAAADAAIGHASSDAGPGCILRP